MEGWKEGGRRRGGDRGRGGELKEGRGEKKQRRRETYKRMCIKVRDGGKEME